MPETTDSPPEVQDPSAFLRAMHPFDRLPRRCARFPASPVYGAGTAMLENRIDHLPIMSDGRILGVVTDTDLLSGVRLQLLLTSSQVLKDFRPAIRMDNGERLSRGRTSSGVPGSRRSGVATLPRLQRFPTPANTLASPVCADFRSTFISERE